MARDPKWDNVDASLYRSSLLSVSNWCDSAAALFAAADLLRPQVEDAWLTLSAWSKDPKNVRPPSRAVFGVYFMLIGFGLENLLKAALVRKHRFDLERDFETKRVLPGRLKTHDLFKLAIAADLRLTSSEENLLRRLTRAAVWFGRYPVPVKSRQRATGQDSADGGYYSVAHFGADDVASITAFVERVYKDLRITPLR